MNWLVVSMKWIMLVSGVLTCTMFYAAIAPQAALRSTFGQDLQGPVAEIVVRNWGVLITLMGAMLIYGAFNVAVRPLILSVAGLSKVAFLLLLGTFGRTFLGHQAATALVSDILQVTLFIAYLVVAPTARRATARR